MSESVSTENSADKKQDENSVKEASKQVCPFYHKKSGCRFGKKCRNLHENPGERKRSSSSDVVSEKSSDVKAVSSAQENCIDSGSASGEEKQNAVKVKDEEKKQENAVNGCASEASDENKENETEVKEAGTNAPAKKVCVYYRRGYCQFGSRCRYLHSRVENKSAKPRSKSTSVLKVDHPEEDQVTPLAADNGETAKKEKAKEASEVKPKAETLAEKKPETAPQGYSELRFRSVSESQANEPRDKQICKFYFGPAGCRFGPKCRNSHDLHQMVPPASPLEKEAPAADTTRRTSDTSRKLSTSSVKGTGKKTKVAVVVPQTTFSLSGLNETDLVKLRTSEVEQLIKRYPRYRETRLADGTLGYYIKFIPSDPDWPYDIKELPLVISFPAEYPREMLQVMIPDETRLPGPVHRTVGSCIDEWLYGRRQMAVGRQQVELVLKPFFRWLDRGLERLFTQGLTVYKHELMAIEAGMEFVPAAELREKYKKREEEAGDSPSTSDDEVPAEGYDGEFYNGPVEEGASDESAESEEEEHSGVNNNVDLDPTRRGTELKALSLQLLESAASLQMTQLAAVVSCERCHNASDVNLPPNQPTGAQCIKCASSLAINLRPALAHPMSSVLGYLDLQGCCAQDINLGQSEFSVQCLGCNHNVKLLGISPGAVSETWCQTCHKKIKVAMESVRCTALTPSTILDGGVAVMKKRVKRLAKDPAIRPGFPLPSEGTCRHYKKSYRWFRFPCCGKTYPCDVCHDENEDGHDMNYATRVVCGFCCREQSYAGERPCLGCNRNMVKKSTQHWEGGKGCRDKIKMARSDDQKYSNMNKTVSRKQQAKSQPKKVIKLRHN